MQQVSRSLSLGRDHPQAQDYGHDDAPIVNVCRKLAELAATMGAVLALTNQKVLR